MATYNPTLKKYLTVAQSRTNNGQKDIRIILDTETNVFYSLDDDGNFKEIAINGSILREYNEEMTIIEVEGYQFINVSVNSGTFEPGDQISANTSNFTFIVGQNIIEFEGETNLPLIGDNNQLEVGETITNLTQSGEATVNISPNPTIDPDTFVILYDLSTGSILNFGIIESRNGNVYKIQVSSTITGLTTNIGIINSDLSRGFVPNEETPSVTEEEPIQISLENKSDLGGTGYSGAGSVLKDNIRRIVNGVYDQQGLPVGGILYSSETKTVEIKTNPLGATIEVVEGSNTSTISVTDKEISISNNNVGLYLVENNIAWINQQTGTAFVLPLDNPSVGDVLGVTDTIDGGFQLGWITP